VTLSSVKRGALSLGGAALLLCASVGISAAQPAAPGQTHSRIAKLIHHELSVAATALGYSDVKAMHGTTLTDLAKAQHVEPATLAAALKADIDAKIQALLDAGKITPKVAARLKARAEARIDKFMTHQFKARAKPNP
jgi:hypothetical protein